MFFVFLETRNSLINLPEKPMNKFALLFLILFVFSFNSCENDEEELSSTPPDLIEIDKSQKSFPSAEGYGQYSTGGRGGEVIYVTNLNDSGEGSFRNAVMNSGKRTVVFAVSGIINLKSLIVIDNPYLTIAGQASPGNGITLKNAGLYIKTHDVIIRHIRIRPGDSDEGHSFEDRDALTIGQDAYNIMIDHVSASWAVDEVISTFYEPQFITIQWCVISEALSDSKHPEGEHSKALLIGDNTQKVSVHHNYFAHNNDRCPVQVKGGASCDVINNIIYNWGEYAFSFAIDYVSSGVKVNLMNNYFKTGNSTTGDFLSEPEKWLDSKLYIFDNIGDDELLSDFNDNRQSYVDQKEYLVNAPVELENNVEISNIAEWNTILTNVGATLPKQDEVDQRVLNDIKNNSGSIIDSQNDVGGYPEWTSIILSTDELTKFDSDSDGMPNEWEIVHNLDPQNPDDRNEDADKDGYTNLEEYLNSF